MATHVVLLRAVNVGGTGKLPMAELRALCEGAGFADVRTYIASGNVVLRSPASARKVRDMLETRLQAHVGKPVGVVVRSAAELAAVVERNPFPQAAGNRLLVLFFNERVPADALASVRHQADEEIHCGEREIYVHYGAGMGQSKLVIPAAGQATGRNLNTVCKLLEMASA